MKLTRLQFSAAFLAALSMLSLLGCGGGGTPSGGSGGTLATSATQYWYESSRTEDSVAKGCYTRRSDDPNAANDNFNPCQGYEFGSDGKYSVWNYEAKEHTGTYSLSGGTISLDDEPALTYSVNASGDTLTLSGTNAAGKKVVFTLKLINILV